MSYLVFVWAASGYELDEREGEPPNVGSTVDEEGIRFLVAKVATSPLPDDKRSCVYLQPV